VSVFLFVKQFVDMMYQNRAMDYFMVIWVLLLLVYQVALVRPNIKERFRLTDGVVVALGLLLTATFVRSGSGYQIYFKVMSAFLIYFVGRVYYDRIRECYGVLVFASYLIIYSNLLVRLHHFGAAFLKVKNAGGDLYYYDTDMAFAMILAMVFIAMFGRNTVFKLFTAFLVCPYMVFFSDAGIQMALMAAIYIIIFIYLVEKVFENKKLADVLLVVIILGLLGIVAVIYMPVLGFENPEFVVGLFHGTLFDGSNMYSRYANWKMILDQCNSQGALVKAFGLAVNADINIESLYVKIFYSLGYVGLGLALLLIASIMYYVARVEDRKTYYLAVIMAVLLLGSGVTVNSMEFTQMSWFPLLFAGMVISSVQEQKERDHRGDKDACDYNGNHPARTANAPVGAAK